MPELKDMNATELLRDAWDRKCLKEYCEIVCVPNIFGCLVDTPDGVKVSKEYSDGLEKARKMFDEISSDPKRMREAVDAFCVSEMAMV